MKLSLNGKYKNIYGAGLVNIRKIKKVGRGHQITFVPFNCIYGITMAKKEFLKCFNPL